MFEFELAKRFLFSKNKDQVHSVRLKTAMFGIFLACLGLFVGAILMSGYHLSFEQAILNFNAHILVKKPIGYLTSSEEQNIQDTLKSYQKKYPHDFSPFTFWEGLIVTNEGMQAVIFKGIDFTKRKNLYSFSYQEKSKPLSKTQGVYIGVNLYKQNPRIVNNKISFLVHHNNKVLRRPFSLNGTFQAGIEPYDSEFVLIDNDMFAKTFFSDQKDFLIGYEIKLKDFEQIQSFAKELEQNLSQELEVITWDRLNSSLLEGLKLEKTTFSIIGFSVLLIACLNIFGFNLMFFLQNKEQFQILRLLGYSKRRIRKLLNYLSLTVAFSASLLALILASLLVIYLNSGDGVALRLEGMPEIQLRAVWNWLWAGLFLAGTWFLCFLTSTFASWVILKQDLKS